MEFIKYSASKPSKKCPCVVLEMHTNLKGSIVNCYNVAMWNGHSFVIWDENLDDYGEINEPDYWMELEFIAE